MPVSELPVSEFRPLFNWTCSSLVTEHGTRNTQSSINPPGLHLTQPRLLDTPFGIHHPHAPRGGRPAPPRPVLGIRGQVEDLPAPLGPPVGLERLDQELLPRMDDQVRLAVRATQQDLDLIQSLKHPVRRPGRSCIPLPQHPGELPPVAAGPTPDRAVRRRSSKYRPRPAGRRRRPRERSRIATAFPRWSCQPRNSRRTH